jgi:hypothetical protein
MSIDVMSQVWKHSMLKDGRELLTLLALADWADDNGGCYPSYDTIAKKVRVKKRTHAIKIVKDLIAAGELFKVGKDANHDSNLFVVLVGADDAAAIKQRITKAAGARGIKTVDNLDERIKEVLALREIFTSPPQRTMASPPQGTDLVPHRGPNTSVNHQSKPSVNGEAANDTPPAPTPTIEPVPLTEKAITAPPGSAPPPKPTDHPYVQAYREVFQRYPPKAQMARIAKMAVTPPGTEQFKCACESWLMKGFRPTNIDGILEWYRDGVPTYQNGKGHRRTTVPAEPYKPPTQAEIDAARSAPILEI